MPSTATSTELYTAAHAHVDRRLCVSKPIVDAALDGNRAALRALMEAAYVAGRNEECLHRLPVRDIKTPATEELQRLALEVADEVDGVRRDYPTLQSIAKLMSSTRTHHAEDAIRAEAKQRALRGRLARLMADAA